ncbi:unnamed protein product [Rhizophagus irregularis]|nr:unnamed protein product [Rhizophagus irregularis]
MKKIRNKKLTEIIKSSDIEPVTINNPNAIYRSRPQSVMINSAISLRSSRSQSINLEKVKRRFKDDLIENSNYYVLKEISYMKIKIILQENSNFDIEMNLNNSKYITEEIDFDIDV